jgi:hypothetical protein
MTNPQPFATIDDLEGRWHPLLDEEKTRASLLLDDASDKIRLRVPAANDPQWMQAHSLTLKRVCCAVVKRAMQQMASGVPEGATQSSETSGPWSNSVSWSNPDGNLYLTKEDLRDLGAAQHRAFVLTAARGDK